MQNSRETYWRYSLIVLLLGLGGTIFIELTPFMGGFLGAITLYVLLRRQMRILTICHRMKRGIAAGLLTGEAIVCFLIPLTLILWILVVKLQDVSLNPSGIIAPVMEFSDRILEQTGYNLLDEKNIAAIVGFVTRAGQWLFGGVINFGLNILVLIFVLYFMLVGGRKMERYLLAFVPFSRESKREIVHELHLVMRSNAIGVPFMALVQGSFAALGYWIFGAPSPLVWGLVTAVGTVIPLVGAALVWVPLVIYLGMMGDWGSAIGLAIYSGVVVGQVDNLGRFLMQKKMADIHPLITIFGVIIGLSLFGFMGVIFGPVLLSLFLFCGNLFKKRFLDN